MSKESCMMQRSATMGKMARSMTLAPKAVAAAVHRMEALHVEDDILGLGHSEKRSETLGSEAVSRQEWSTLRLFCFEGIRNIWFNTLVGCLVCVNMFIVVIETNYRSRNEEVPTYVAIFSIGALLFFTFELLARIFALRSRFWGYWNLLDVLVVSADWVFELASLLLSRDAIRPVAILRVLRMLRALRVLRSVRTMSLFRELYVMLHGFFSTIKAIFWASLLLMLILTWWAIIAVEFIHPCNVALQQEGYYNGCERCGRAFASVQEAMVTFIQQLIAGDSWGLVTIPLMEQYPATAPIFMMVLVSVNLGFLNLILSVIVDSAAEVHKDDTEFYAEERNEKIEAAKKDLKLLCMEIDADHSGQISNEELKNGYQNIPEFKHTMQRMDVTPDEIDALFRLVDADRSGSISYEEFAEQMAKLKMTDGAMSNMLIKSSLKDIEEKLSGDIERIHAEVSRLHGEVSRLAKAVRYPAGDTFESSPSLTSTYSLQQKEERRPADVPVAGGRVLESKLKLEAEQRTFESAPDGLEPVWKTQTAQLILSELGRHRERLDDQFQCLLRLVQASAFPSGDVAAFRLQASAFPSSDAAAFRPVSQAADFPPRGPPPRGPASGGLEQTPLAQAGAAPQGLPACGLDGRPPPVRSTWSTPGKCCAVQFGGDTEGIAH